MWTQATVKTKAYVYGLLVEDFSSRAPKRSGEPERGVETRIFRDLLALFSSSANDIVSYASYLEHKFLNYNWLKTKNIAKREWSTKVLEAL